MRKNSLNNDDIEKIAIRFTRWIGSPSSVVAHSVFFIVCFISPLFGLPFDRMLLFLTTIVSLEAIYLGILIQFTVNRSQENIQEVVKDIDEIQEDIDEIQTDVGEIQEDIDEIQEDVDEIQTDVVVIEEGEEKDLKRDKATHQMIATIQSKLELLLQDIEKLKVPQEITTAKIKKSTNTNENNRKSNSGE